MFIAVNVISYIKTENVTSFPLLIKGATGSYN